MRPRERPRSGPTDNRFVIESAGGHAHLAVLARSRMVTLDRALAHPAAERRGFTAARRARRSKATGLQTGFSELATAYRSLQRMIDARARPRAVNPPPREAPASVRVGPACAVRPPPPVKATKTRPLVLPLRMSPSDASCAARCGGKPPSATSTPGISLRWCPVVRGRKEPCRLSTLSAYPLRGRRLFRGEDGAPGSARLGGGKEPGEFLLRAAWAEHRRVKGTEPV